MSAILFSPLQIRSIQFKNRIFMAPMCQYSAIDGVAQDWHRVHLGARAAGGSSLLIIEATGISPEARITKNCLGLWNDSQSRALQPIVQFIRDQGAVAGIQLAHAGRKASVFGPFAGHGSLPADQGGWQTIAPSAIGYHSTDPVPRAMTLADMIAIKAQFVNAAHRALAIGLQVLELHMAHGYLLHQYLSPLSNMRLDDYGGSLENRMRFPLEIVEAVRAIWPQNLALFVRISATDWVEGGWDLAQSLEFCHQLKKRGVDFIDVSSGGLSPLQNIKPEPLYQVSFAGEIKDQCKISTGAVGLITTANQAETILQNDKADAVLLGRELLRNPTWPLQAAHALGSTIQWPWQYARATFS